MPEKDQKKKVFVLLVPKILQRFWACLLKLNVSIDTEKQNWGGSDVENLSCKYCVTDFVADVPFPLNVINIKQCMLSAEEILKAMFNLKKKDSGLSKVHKFHYLSSWLKGLR